MANIDWSKAPEGYEVHIDWGGRTDSHFYREEGDRYMREGGYHASKSDFPMEGVVVTLRPAQAAWNGEGLPPVGTVCELQHSTWADGRWEKRRINYVGDIHLITCDPEDGLDSISYIDKMKFRPIRTAEQIAAEERLASAYAMCAIAKSLSNADAVLLYDAGYGKIAQPSEQGQKP